MRRMHLAAAAVVAAILTMLLGCEDPQPVHQPNFLEDNPWTVKRRGDAGSVASNGETRVDNPIAGQAAVSRAGESYLSHPSTAVPIKPDDPIDWPIWAAKGKWTVRLAFYNPTPDKGLSALYYANRHAKELRRKGYEAYITDLITKAIVSVGSFDSPNDPQLVALWKEAYEDWTKIYGNRVSPFREAMQRFYGQDTIFGDQPWPVAVIEMQVAMKNAYHVPLTDEDKKKLQEFSKLKVTSGENP